MENSSSRVYHLTKDKLTSTVLMQDCKADDPSLLIDVNEDAFNLGFRAPLIQRKSKKTSDINTIIPGGKQLLHAVTLRKTQN